MPTETTSAESRTSAARLRQERDVEEAARAALNNHCHFRGRAAHFSLTVVSEMLVVGGAVPSFYLKQSLQSVLKKIEGVQRIANHVVVVSSHGLSSDPPSAKRSETGHGRSSQPCASNQA